MRGNTLFALILSFSLLALAACGPKQEEADPTAELWAQVEQAESRLETLRSDLEDIEQQLAAAAAETEEEAEEAVAEGEAAVEAEAAPTVEELEARVAELQEEIASTTDELSNKTIEFLNSSEMFEGEPLTPQQQRAFDIKSEIDAQIAQEYIDEGGDYGKAIDIYETALRNNPENEILLAGLEEAQRLRYMTEERFNSVKKGMSVAEVRETLGVAMARNQRPYPERGLVGWFYPKENKGAAAVYFEASPEYFEAPGEHDLGAVQILDFDAVKPQTEGEEEG